MFNAMKKGFGSVIGVWCGLMLTMYLNDKLIRKAECCEDFEDQNEVN